jgi:cytochrome c-type biogenesis protein CcmE
MRKRSQRLWLIGAAAALVTGAVALAVVGLQGAVAFFQSPSDIAAKGTSSFKQALRVGGLIEVGSQKHEEGGKLLTFTITEGIPPDMVKEGKGVVAEGKFNESGVLVADRVLAKHDENYMPKEAYDALKRASEADGETTYGKEPTT